MSVQEWISLLQLQVFFSVVLFALAEANYKFIWADIGGKGSASEAQIYNGSELKEKLEKVTLGLPDPDVLPNDNEPTNDTRWPKRFRFIDR